MIGTIVSVNVGLPQDVAWQGRSCSDGGVEDAGGGAGFRPSAEISMATVKGICTAMAASGDVKSVATITDLIYKTINVLVEGGYGLGSGAVAVGRGTLMVGKPVLVLGVGVLDP